MQLRLREQSQSLNYLIRVRADAVHGLQIQAQGYLAMKQFMQPELPYGLQENATGTYYHLDNTPEKRLVGNLVGKGSLAELTLDQRREIDMAYSLNPHFRALKENPKTLLSLYYVSDSGFENHFPWKPSQQFKWEQNSLKSRFLADLSVYHLPYGILNWSDIYSPKGEAQIIVTCAASIYQEEKFLGVVAVDFTLENITDFIASIVNPYGRLLLVNNYESVIADTNFKNTDNPIIVKSQQALPEGLTLEEINKLPRKELSRLGDFWVFQVKSRYAPWTLIYYVSSSKLVLTTLEEIGPSVLFLILAAVLILGVSNTLIAQEFIRPAHQLVHFIASHAREGKDVYQKVPKAWVSWFEDVNRVFQENKELVDRLELHIHELDSMVNQRTREISNKNQALTKALQDLTKVQKQMVVQEKLAGLGALTAGIAHEIKNPLNYVINFSELSCEYVQELIAFIQDYKVDQQEEVMDILYSLTHNLQRIEDHGKRADAIIRSMLMHARTGVNEPEEVDINKLVEENATLAISGLRQQRFLPKLTKKFEANLPLLQVYPQELGRVILNIVNNGCYALYQKKTEETQIFEAEIQITTYRQDDNIVIKIKDNGSGIPEEIRQSIFMPFFTTKPTGNGTGLGLSLSYEIITQQHHGSLTVESERDQYTEFTITLPLDASS
ncbi:MAG: ATP-binding protein [Janthinobacterium lividum]